MKAEQVVSTMEGLRLFAGRTPKRIQVDNGSEFISKALDKWACENKATLDFSRPGKPTDNALIESFNGSFGDECLNTYWFLSLDDARQKIEDWRQDYNQFRPCSSLGNMAPDEFAERASKVGNPYFCSVPLRGEDQINLNSAAYLSNRWGPPLGQALLSFLMT